MVINPNRNAKYIINLIRASISPPGNPDGGTRDYCEAALEGRVQPQTRIFRLLQEGCLGPVRFLQRQFNVTFPEQFKLDYSRTARRDRQFGSVDGRRSRNEDRHPGAVPVIDAENDELATGKATTLSRPFFTSLTSSRTEHVKPRIYEYEKH